MILSQTWSSTMLASYKSWIWKHNHPFDRGNKAWLDRWQVNKKQLQEGISLNWGVDESPVESCIFLGKPAFCNVHEDVEASDSKINQIYIKWCYGHLKMEIVFALKRPFTSIIAHQVIWIILCYRNNRQFYSKLHPMCELCSCNFQQV